MIDLFRSYAFNLIHPFQGHEMHLAGEKDLPKLSLYESLGISWLITLVAGFIKMIMIACIISIFVNIMDPASNLLTGLYGQERFIGFYFLILTTILDVIFFPLFELFLVQFWEFVFRIYAQLMGGIDDLEDKSKDILTLSLSSHLMAFIPIIGSFFQKIARFIHIYAGLRVQFKYSPALSICILLTPVFILLLIGFVLFAGIAFSYL